jgi:hypothetical protein
MVALQQAKQLAENLIQTVSVPSADYSFSA